jgi:hypothetical protein
MKAPDNHLQSRVGGHNTMGLIRNGRKELTRHQDVS